MNALLPFLAQTLVKVTLLVAVAALADRALAARKASAAARHLAWALAIVAMIVLPVLALVLPRWNVLPGWSATVSERAAGTQAFVVDSRPATVAATDEQAATSETLASHEAAPNAAPNAAPRHASANTRVAPGNASAPASTDTRIDARIDARATRAVDERNVVPGARSPARIPWAPLLAGAYLAGVVAILLRVVLERRAIRRLEQGASLPLDGEWNALLESVTSALGIRRRVTLLQSGDATIPLTWGVRDHVVLVPESADAWPASRRRAVLVHELAHVARQDCLTGTLAVIACAVYWPHPGVWYAAHRLRMERELACDDQVLARGISAYDYAGHLLAIARSARTAWSPTALAVPMGTPSNLEIRMRAAIDGSRVRSAPSGRARAAAVLLGAVLMLPIAAVHARGEVQSGQGATARDASAGNGATAQAPPPTPVASGVVTSTTVTSATTDSIVPSGSSRFAAAATVGSVLALPASRVSSPATSPDSSSLAADARTAQSRYTGTWFMRPASRNEAPDGTPAVHMMFNTNGINTFVIPLAKLEGLPDSVRLGTRLYGKFQLRRDPGTFNLTGTFQDGEGKGTFDFVPNDAFADALVARGMTRPTGQQLFSMAKHGVGLDLLDELKAQGYAQPTTYMLDRVGMTSVDVEWLRKMNAIGYRFGTVERAIGLTNHSIDAAYIEQQNARMGRRLSADELMAVKMGRYASLRVTGETRPGTTAATPPAPVTRTTVSPAISVGASDAGAFGNTPTSGRWIITPTTSGMHLELQWDDDTQWRRLLSSTEAASLPAARLSSADPTDVSFRFDQDAGRFDFIGGARNRRGEGKFQFTVKREFVNTMRSLGITGLDQVSDHELKNLAYGGISAAAIRDFQALGMGPLSKEELLELAIRSVTPDYARAMIGFGVNDAKSARTLAELKFLGMPAEYVGDLAGAGYRGLSSEQLFALRRAGVTSAFIRALRDGGAGNLSVDELLERASAARRR